MPRLLAAALLGLALALPTAATADVPFACTGEGARLGCIETDRAHYAPGEPVVFTLTLRQPLDGQTLAVRYHHLGAVVDAQAPAAGGDGPVTWTWTAPGPDGRGYLAEVRLEADGVLLERVTIGVDVTSDWSRFPRYGFLSVFAGDDGLALDPARIDAVVRRLNRFHLNGLQFYDWHYKHHDPLKGTAENPAVGWRDIAGRPIYFETVDAYIDAAHARDMHAMAYNLLFGAFRDADDDGVDLQAWGLFTDPGAQNQDYHPLPGWASDIMLMNPADTRWQDYLFAQTAEALAALPFDGWHVDQLGDRGTRYDAQGRVVDLPAGYQALLTRAADELDTELVMNAVNQFGQSQIAQAPVEFLYTEVWPPNTSFTNLRQIIADNDQAGGGALQTVLAAYVNYDLGSTPGPFNAPSVLMADAVIFASGGAHLELGEHMLSTEYFPNDNRTVTPELERRLIDYYDFLVAYENLLRGENTTTGLRLASPEARIAGFQSLGGLWSFARAQGDRRVAHLINLTDATTLSWQDNDGVQAAPEVITDLPLSFTAERTVVRVWAATPDADGGTPAVLDFTQQGDAVTLTLPSLEYWTMLVVEYEPLAMSAAPERPGAPGRPALGANYPDPFGAETVIPYRVDAPGPVRLQVYDTLGHPVRTLVDAPRAAGRHEAVWDGTDAAGRRLASGVYVYRLAAGSAVESGTMVLVR